MRMRSFIGSACEADGLQCPQDVFTQLFSEEANNEGIAVIVRHVERAPWFKTVGTSSSGT